MPVLTKEQKEAIDKLIVQTAREILADIDKDNIEDCLYELQDYLSDFRIDENGVVLPNGYHHYIDTLY